MHYLFLNKIVGEVTDIRNVIVKREPDKLIYQKQFGRLFHTTIGRFNFIDLVTGGESNNNYNPSYDKSLY